VHVFVPTQEPVDDLVARNRCRAVAGEGIERLGLTRADAARDGDGDRA
jgi:hypothetical protein